MSADGIQLHGGITLVDEADKQLLISNINQWRVRQFNKNAHYVAMFRNRECILLHRLITNAKDGEVVDHINGNSLDNRRQNLRTCTHAENMRNRRLNKNSTSGLKGASWIAKYKRWQATINCNSRSMFLGYFDTAQEAHEAYCKAAIVLHGAFARFC